MFTLFTLELLGTKKTTLPGASERLPSRRCPLHHSHPLLAQPFWGPQPWPWHYWLKGPGMEIRREPQGLECGPGWPLPSPLSRSNLDLQKSSFFLWVPS